jgi:hypothetical protein
MSREVDSKRVHSFYQHETRSADNAAMHVKKLFKVYDSTAGRVVALRDVTFKVNKG